MGSSRAVFKILVPFLLIPSFVFVLPDFLGGQEADRIWGRVTTVSGDVHEGFIRWDRNEGSWMDLLDGSKEFSPFQFQDWWILAHPGDRARERVIELAGYRITWDDNEPDFPDIHESGIRFGHIRSLTVAGDDMATLELRSGRFVDLERGSTDLGEDLREILVMEPDGNVEKLEWEELESVDFMAAPPGARAAARRLHGTIELGDGSRFTGYVAWDMQKILTSDTLVGLDSDEDRQEIPFSRVTAIRPAGDGAEITLTGGEKVMLFESEDVSDDNDGVQISDPGFGLLEVDWDEMEMIRFHPPEAQMGLEGFDGGQRLHGTVLTADSTEITGWIRWDGDEMYSWELLDGYFEGVGFDIELGKVASIEKLLEMNTAVEVGPTGMTVERESVEGASVILRDGRTFELTGSNDVDSSNDGVFVLVDGSGRSPDDEDAEWVMVRWEDFLAVQFDWGEGP